ncbi:uncharacterized protein VP01_1008g5 [Puccinia sorghi]|uniref:Uncharacterized protein n=1 Tax=Puccinia sorghi TaxID=27349 RepID=A0A0L6VVJ7_9BASI|nr:uncharacterized protein VP01_1008g5 [Puccinia sorghi]
MIPHSLNKSSCLHPIQPPSRPTEDAKSSSSEVPLANPFPLPFINKSSNFYSQFLRPIVFQNLQYNTPGHPSSIISRHLPWILLPNQLKHLLKLNSSANQSNTSRPWNLYSPMTPTSINGRETSTWSSAYALTIRGFQTTQPNILCFNLLDCLVDLKISSPLTDVQSLQLLFNKISQLFNNLGKLNTSLTPLVESLFLQILVPAPLNMSRSQLFQYISIQLVEICESLVDISLTHELYTSLVST